LCRAFHGVRWARGYWVARRAGNDLVRTHRADDVLFGELAETSCSAGTAQTRSMRVRANDLCRSRRHGIGCER